MTRAGYIYDTHSEGHLANDRRRMRRMKVGDTSIEIEVMIYNRELTAKRPLVIVNSIDLPMPPSVQFCEKMWNAGYQVIFIRRPGFGFTASLPAALMVHSEVNKLAPVAAETALLSIALETLGLQDVILLGMGTSNSICMRLAQLNANIAFTVYANPLFHPAIWDVIRPPWLKRMIRQTVLSKSGLKIAVRGLRAVLRRDSLWFYQQFAQKSPGDQAYVSANEADFKKAGLFLQNMPPDVFFYELRTALMVDTEWNPDTSGSGQAVILSGVETTDKWTGSITKEAERLDLPIIFADSGDLFVPYASPDKLLDILKTYAGDAVIF
ncbi:MAG: hypothetical protein NXH72_09395 [Hyphomonadaceae bacterium]|nr:hypothetical protein [Hyphomonadaceae bacterium]